MDPPKPQWITELREETRKRSYIILPGAAGGDIWYCAGAQILMSQPQPHGGHTTRPVTVLTILFTLDKGSNRLYDDNSMTLGEPSFRYYRDIGLPVIVVLLEAKFLAGKEIIDVLKAANPTLLQAAEDLCFGHPDMPFHEVLDHAPVIQDGQAPNSIQFVGMMPSTTIIGQYLRDDAKKAIEVMQKRLCSPSDPNAEWFKAAHARYEELKLMVAEAKAGKPPGHRVILFNFRRSDKNPWNNTNNKFLGNVDLFLKAKDFGYIGVAQGAGADVIASKNLFNLYKTEAIGNNFVPIDKRTLVHFWTLVARDHDILGLFGPRSGSIDLASFMGVDCLTLDEPVWAIQKDYYSSPKDNGRGLEHLSSVRVQNLRLFQQYPTMRIGWLAAISGHQKQQVYEFDNFDAVVMEAWLAGKELPILVGITEESSTHIQELLRQLEALGFQPIWKNYFQVIN